MAAVRAHGPALVTNAAATKYTVPAGMRFIIRHIHVQNPGATIDLTMSIGADAAGTRIFDGFPLPADGPYDHFCYYAMAAAEILQALCSVTNQAVLTVDGDLEAV